MKYFFTALWTLICIAVLIFGHQQWQEKISAHADGQKESAKTSAPAAVKEKPKQANVDTANVLTMAKNWPDPAKNQLQQSLKAKKSFKILFVGSEAQNGWIDAAKSKIVAAYGKDVIKVASRTYDLTTAEFVEKNDQLEIAAEKPQLVIFEPLVLNDNGKVEIIASQANITKIIADVTATVPEATFILQPSYPLYNAKFYPIQVDALKTYAKKSNLTYLDHWAVWPKTSDVKLKEYLTADKNSVPNDKGNQVWSQFIVDYLVAK